MRHGLQITGYPAIGTSELFLAKATRYLLFDFLIRKSRSARLLVKGTSGVFGEEQHGFLVKLESLPQIMGIGFGDTTTFATGFGRDGG